MVVLLNRIVEKIDSRSTGDDDRPTGEDDATGLRPVSIPTLW